MSMLLERFVPAKNRYLKTDIKSQPATFLETTIIPSERNFSEVITYGPYDQVSLEHMSAGLLDHPKTFDNKKSGWDVQYYNCKNSTITVTTKQYAFLNSMYNTYGRWLLYSNTGSSSSHNQNKSSMGKFRNIFGLALGLSGDEVLLWLWHRYFEDHRDEAQMKQCFVPADFGIISPKSSKWIKLKNSKTSSYKEQIYDAIHNSNLNRIKILEDLPKNKNLSLTNSKFSQKNKSFSGKKFMIYGTALKKLAPKDEMAHSWLENLRLLSEDEMIDSFKKMWSDPNSHYLTRTNQIGTANNSANTAHNITIIRKKGYMGNGLEEICCPSLSSEADQLTDKRRKYTVITNSITKINNHDNEESETEDVFVDNNQNVFQEFLDTTYGNGSGGKQKAIIPPMGF